MTGRRWWNLAWLGAMVATGVTLLGLSLVPLLRDDVSGTAGSLVGRPAPAIDGVELAEEKRLVWVNFWAASCEPCRTEMPAMQALSELYHDRLVVVGVNRGESPDSVRDFAERYAIGYRIVLDPRLATYGRWTSSEGLPRHYFVLDGIVVREIVGPLDPQRMTRLLEERIGPA